MEFKKIRPNITVDGCLLDIFEVILLKKPLIWAVILKSSVYACLIKKSEWNIFYSIYWKSLLVPSLNWMKFKVTLPDSTVGRRLLYISVVILLKKPLMWALILKSSVYACLIKKSRWNVFSVFALCRSGWLGKLQKMISFARPPLAFPFKYLIWKSQRNYQHFYTFTAPRCLIFSRMIYIEKESRLLVYDIPNPL